MFGDVLAHIPRLVSYQHLWAHSPALCRAPCPASPFRLRRSVLRHSVGAGWWVVEVVDDAGVDGVFHKRVRCRGCNCWPRCGSSCWPSSVLMVWASLVFEVVGVLGGRGLVCRVSCPRPLPGVTRPASPECLSPQSRGWLWGCRRVACWWTTSLSIAYSTRVFDVVGVAAGRGVGCPGGRGRCRWGWLFVCSRLWLCSMAADWVVVLAVAVVDGVFHKSVRCCGCVQWSWYGSW